MIELLYTCLWKVLPRERGAIEHPASQPACLRTCLAGSSYAASPIQRYSWQSHQCIVLYIPSQITIDLCVILSLRWNNVSFSPFVERFHVWYRGKIWHTFSPVDCNKKIPINTIWGEWDIRCNFQMAAFLICPGKNFAIR